jgi:NAD(P)-dependent dehydrogenase (short-subunit alcohol dehydrogenase family)
MSNSLHALFDLSGRVALITGGSRGLGLQIGEALSEFGARLVLVARKQGELDAAVARFSALGAQARGIATDLADPHAVQPIMESIARCEGRLDILVNNAGTTWGAPAEHYPLQSWDKVLSLNLTAPWLLIQAAANTFFLPQHGGAVVNVASTEGLQGHSHHRLGTVAYNASKGAVINMTRALAAEWGPKRIRVNAVAPGFFPTKMTAATLETSGDDMIAATPLGRLGGEHDLKGVILLLASEAGAHITGQTIVVDGGATVI